MERLDMLKMKINLKNIFYEDRELQDIMIEFYLIQVNFIISRLGSVQKRIWHQSQKIASSSDTNQSTKSQKYKSNGVNIFYCIH